MKKKINLSLIVSSVICLLPVILALVLYNDLPEQVAVHWDNAGTPNNYVPKPVAAFGLPFLLLVIHLFVRLSVENDPKKANASVAIRALGNWIVPLSSVVLIPVTLFIALGADIKLNVILPAVVGVLFVILGNYLPKCKQSYTVGIRLPWTLSSEENWKKTHHMAGYVWILGGILLIINAFLPAALFALYITVITVVILSPAVYSFVLYKKGI